MINYQLGKIYKIVGNNKIYVGSTCERLLCQRLAGHNGAYKLYQKGLYRNVTSFQCLSDPYHYIELLELCPCDSKDELHKCERKWIEQLDCVNKIIPGRTHKQYLLDNKDKIKEQKKAYIEANKEQINEQLKAYREANKDKIKAYREANKEYQEAYYEINKDKIKEHKKAYREAHKQQSKEYREANKERRNKQQRQRRARQKLIINQDL